MFFDYKSKTYTGKLHRTTKEDVNRMQQLIERGVCVSTAHPSDEELTVVNEFLARRDMEKEENDAIARMKQVQKEG